MWFWLATAGILFSAGAGILAGFWAWSKPFNKSDFDIVWAIVTLVFCAAIGLTFRLKQGRFLISIHILLFAFLLLISMVHGRTASAVLVLIWLTAISAGIGNYCLTRFFSPVITTGTERFILSTALGFGLLIFLTFTLAALHLLSLTVMFSFLIVLTAVLFRSLIRMAIEFRTALGRVRSAWRSTDLSLASIAIAAGCICILSSLVWALSPAIQHDALRYHLGAPVLYIQNHGMIEIPEDNSTYYAHNGEMLYTLALMVAGQPLPSLLHLAFFLLTLPLIYSLGRSVGGTRTAALATLLFVSLPLVTWQSGIADIDMIVTFFTFGSIYCAYQWWTQKQDSWLTISGILAGLGLGTKLNAALVILPLSIFIFIALTVRNASPGPVLRGLVRFHLPAFALLAPWLVREFIWTGNPIFPYFYGAPEEYGSYSGRTPDKGVSVMIQRAGKWDEFLDFIRLPWELSVRLYDESTPRGRLAGITLLALPWFYLRRSTSSNLIVCLALLSLATSFLWNFVSDVSRYLLPVLPVFAILAALNIDFVLKQIPENRFSKYLQIFAMAIALCYLAATRLSSIVAGWAVPERFPYRVALGVETRHQYLSRTLPVYDAYQYLEQQGAQKVLSIGNDFRVYSKARVHGVLGSSYLRHYIASLPPTQKLLDTFHEVGYDFLLLDLNNVNHFYEPEFFQVSAIKESFLSRFTRLEFANRNVYVHRILKQESFESHEPANLLTNSGFEQIKEDRIPAEWFGFGDHALENKARTGASAVRVWSAGCLIQRVPVHPGELYTLGHWSRSDRTKQNARLQINWLDANSNLIDASIQVIPVTSEWQWNKMSANAPKGARFAQVYASAHEQDEVTFDDFEFVQGTLYGRESNVVGR